MKDFRKLEIWKKSHRMALDIYAITRSFPKEEIYGLTGQMRRASVSIAANIAEGCGKRTDAEFARYIQIAIGSASEVEYYIELSKDLEYIESTSAKLFEQQIQEIKRMLTGFIKRLREKAES